MRISDETQATLRAAVGAWMTDQQDIKEAIRVGLQAFEDVRFDLECGIVPEEAAVAEFTHRADGITRRMREWDGAARTRQTEAWRIRDITNNDDMGVEFDTKAGANAYLATLPENEQAWLTVVQSA